MRQPFRGSPSSLLQGDEFFLPQLNRALGLLAKPSGAWRSPKQAPIDLSITTTVLNGNQCVSVDSMGQQLGQSMHSARFHWQRLPSTPADADPFGISKIARTADRLALAARSTASFPVAFEPSFVPVNSPLHAEPPDDTAPTETQRLRPDMADVVKDWGEDGHPRNRSRFAVDGGLLANTPTKPALEATESMPDSGPVRRVMLLVFPHAEPPGTDRADEQGAPPTLVGTIGGLLGALTAQGSRTFVEEIEEHNKRAAGRRGTREDVLKSVVTFAAASGKPGPSSWKQMPETFALRRRPDQLESLAEALYPHYCRLRRWRTARNVARRVVEHAIGDSDPASTLPDGWNYERVRRAALSAQESWEYTCERPSPYYPEKMPRRRHPQPGKGWNWGVSGALGVAEAAADVLSRLIWVTTGEDYATVERTRTTISEQMARIRDAVKLTDDVWRKPDLAALQPNESYWSMRLAYYEYLMTEQGAATRLTAKITQVVRNETVARGRHDVTWTQREDPEQEQTGERSPEPGAQGTADRTADR